MTTERRQENKFIVYTDIVGHTKMLGRLGMAFKPMRERHDELFRLAVASHADSSVMKGSGDGFYAAFEDVDDALEVALQFRRSLATEDWNRYLPEGKKTPDNHIKSRVGIHSGLVRVQFENGVAVDFDGAPRNVTEKVMSKALGNQVLVSRQVRDQGNLNFRRNGEVQWQKYGEFKLREVADTVEIWGLGEAEFPAGSPPVQDPEHRVIIFAVVHDHSTVIEQSGPQFEGLKDKWDATFQKAVDAHSRDAFVKKLPEGSLAAFRTAIEAVRAARDFRRMWKAEMRTSIHRLEPKTALDSGLVTFNYENNRPSDVRDQPVNMAAKVAKTGLTVSWQLLLTRPVREDAFSNMPERDEFGWVCIGRKMVPGEPEPVELWDFQDVQAKKEERAVLWVDLTHIRDDLKSRRDVYVKFVTRLDAMLTDALGRRAEEAWTLQPDAARIAAFRDPVEAVQAAMDLRDHALIENWGALFQNRGKGWHPLKIALHLGAVRMTSEDGQRKDIKGAPVDGIKVLTSACEMSQVLVSREFKEAVARHLPESAVHWKRVEVPAKDDVAIEGFALESRAAGGMPTWQKLAAAGVAAAVLIGGGVVVVKSFSGGGGGGAEVIGTTVQAGQLVDALDKEFKEIQSTDKGFAELKDAVYTKIGVIAVQERNVSPKTQTSIKAVTAFLRELAKTGNDQTHDLKEVIASHVPALAAVKDGQTLGEWTAKAKDDSEIPFDPDPRDQANKQYQQLKDTLIENGLDKSELAGELESKGKIPDDKQKDKLPWIGKNKKAIADVCKAVSEQVKGTATVTGLRGKINAAIVAQSPTDDALPMALRTSLTEIRTQTLGGELRFLMQEAQVKARERAEKLKPLGEEAIQKELGPQIKAIADAVRDLRPFDVELFVIEKAPEPKKLDFEQIARLLSDELPAYRILDEKQQSVLSEWSDRVGREFGRLSPERRSAPAPVVAAARDEVRKALDEFPPYSRLPWIARNRAEVNKERERVEGLFKALKVAVDADIKANPPVQEVATVKLGPLPESVASVVNALASDPSELVSSIGKSAKSVVEASWEESRRLNLSQEAAMTPLQPVLAQLQQLAAKKGSLDAAAIAADKAKIGEPGEKPGALGAWLLRLSDYVKIEGEDPRPLAEKRLADLQTQYVGMEEGKLPDSDLPKDFRDAKAELRQISVADYPWIEKNREVVAGTGERLAKLLAPGGTVEASLKRAVNEAKGAKLADRLRDELDKVMDNPPVLAAEEPDIFAGWDAIRREAAGQRGSSDVDTLKQVLQRIKDDRAALAAIPKTLPPPQVDADRPWARSVAQAMTAQRSSAIKAVIESRGKPQAEEAKKSYSTALSRVNGFIKSWKAIEDAFRGGGQLQDPVPDMDGKRLGEVIALAMADPMLADTPENRGVRDGLRVLTHRAEAMQGVAKIDRAKGGSFTDLLRYAEDSEVGIETRVAVWNSMEYGAYADEPTWLDYHKRVFGRVEASLAAMTDRAKAEQFKTFLEKDKTKRWFMHVGRLTGYDTIDRAMTDRTSFNVTDGSIEQAAPALRWNLRVWKIDAARRAGAGAEQATRSAIAELLGDSAALNAVKGDPAATSFVAALREADSGSSNGGGQPQMTGAALMGPGREGWSLVEGVAGGEKLVYQMKDPENGTWVFPGRDAPRLTFQKVRHENEESYLCTTELSVRIVFETLKRTDGIGSFLGLFAGTQREGPWVWDFDQSKSMPLMVGFAGDKINGKGKGGWVKLADARETEYFGNQQVTPPDADMPIQYVSLPGAVFLSRQLGCRLPSTGEWASAAQSDGASPAKANLRDQAFKSVFDAAKLCKDRVPGVTDLDRDQNWPSKGADKSRFAASNDGVVFFAPVDQDAGGGTFRHLIGNVAEIVCDNRKGAEALGRGLSDASGFVLAPAQAQAFAIIGDSAIGEVRPNPAEPRRLAVSQNVKALTNRGWSDVGLRLAFSPVMTAPQAPEQQADLLAKLRQAFDSGRPYVPASKGT